MYRQGLEPITSDAGSRRLDHEDFALGAAESEFLLLPLCLMFIFLSATPACFRVCVCVCHTMMVKREAKHPAAAIHFGSALHCQEVTGELLFVTNETL